MMRSRWWALAVVAALGCSREAAPVPEARGPTTAVTVDQEAPPAPSAAASASAASSARAGEGDPLQPPADLPPFSQTELSPTQGELTPLLRAQVERARAKKLVPLVEFYADWCGPCRAFQDNLGDPKMEAALRGTYLVRLNLDDWHDKLASTGFTVKSIPRFYLLRDDGRPSGAMLDGDAWGRSTPANMSAALARLLGH